MISIGYEPETGVEHLVPDAEQHPGAHLLSEECPCAPYKWDEDVWKHQPMPRRSCPDDGTCHHECGVGYCFRVEYAEPLSFAGWGSQWPEDIRRTYGKPGHRVSATAEQQAIVTLSLANCNLRRELHQLTYLRRKEFEELEEERRQLTARWRGAASITARRQRPYEGSLWRELRHAVRRWKSYRGHITK